MSLIDEFLTIVNYAQEYIALFGRHINLTLNTCLPNSILHTQIYCGLLQLPIERPFFEVYHAPIY